MSEKLVRDPRSGFIINTDTREYDLLVKARIRRRRETSNAREIERLKSEITDLKAALGSVLEALKNR